MQGTEEVVESQGARYKGTVRAKKAVGGIRTLVSKSGSE